MGIMNENERRTLVDSWDAPTRVLHWVNAILIIVLGAMMLSLEGLESFGLDDDIIEEAVEKLHAYIGYVLAVTFSLRALWGFAGNKYARWSDIIPYRKEQRQGIGADIRWYLSGFKGSPAKAAGHDPLASLFYIAVFIVLASQAVTGIIMAGMEFDMFPGPLFNEGADGEEGIGEAFEEIHEFGLWFFIFFLFAHLGGLIVHEIKEKTGLFTSMINGKKYFPEDEDR